MLAERSENYRFMITKFVEINNNQYERELEKKRQSGSIYAHSEKNKRYKTTYPRKIKIDVIHRSKKF